MKELKLKPHESRLETPITKFDLLKELNRGHTDLSHIRSMARAVYKQLVTDAWTIDPDPAKNNHPGCVMGGRDDINKIADACGIKWETANKNLERLAKMNEITVDWLTDKTGRSRVQRITINRLSPISEKGVSKSGDTSSPKTEMSISKSGERNRKELNDKRSNKTASLSAANAGARSADLPRKTPMEKITFMDTFDAEDMKLHGLKIFNTATSMVYIYSEFRAETLYHDARYYQYPEDGSSRMENNETELRNLISKGIHRPIGYFTKTLDVWSAR